MGDKGVDRIETAVEKEVKETAAQEINIKHKVHHFKLEGFSKKGEDQWYLEGITAKLLDNDIVLNNIKGENFGKEVTVMLTADQGVYRKDCGATELTGNVVIVTSDGGRLVTDYAKWDAVKEEVATDAYVKIEHNGITLEGKGALVKPKEQWAILEKEIKTKDATRVITCDGPLEVNYKEKKAIFNNNVEIVDEQGKMYAKKLVAYFNTETRSIEKLEWVGDVKAVY